MEVWARMRITSGSGDGTGDDHHDGSPEAMAEELFDGRGGIRHPLTLDIGGEPDVPGDAAPDKKERPQRRMRSAHSRVRETSICWDDGPDDERIEQLTRDVREMRVEMQHVKAGIAECGTMLRTILRELTQGSRRP